MIVDIVFSSFSKLSKSFIHFFLVKLIVDVVKILVRKNCLAFLTFYYVIKVLSFLFGICPYEDI